MSPSPMTGSSKLGLSGTRKQNSVFVDRDSSSNSLEFNFEKQLERANDFRKLESKLDNELLSDNGETESTAVMSRTDNNDTNFTQKNGYEGPQMRKGTVKSEAPQAL